MCKYIKVKLKNQDTIFKNNLLTCNQINPTFSRKSEVWVIVIPKICKNYNENLSDIIYNDLFLRKYFDK